MNLKRCANGHFYDVDKYASCPHCAGGSGVDNSMSSTVAYSQDMNMHSTVPAEGSQQGATVGATVGYTGGGMGTTEAYQGSFGGQATVGDSGETKKNSILQRYVEDLDIANSDNSFGTDNDIKTVRYSAAASGIDPTVGWLVCLSGNNTGKSYILKTGKNFIGRGNDMDIVLTGDGSVSRNRHAVILYEPRKREFLAQPGESKELYYINDEVVLNATRLQPYDRISIGETMLCFVPFCGENFGWDELEK